MKNAKLFLWIMISALLLAACTPNATPPPQAGQPTPPPGVQNPAAAQLALELLAGKLGVDPSEVTLQKAEPVDWPDSCLGLGGPAESCLAAVTPGYRLEFVSGGKTYEVRTDLEGGQMRGVDFDLPKGGVVSTPEDQTKPAVSAAIEALAQQIGVDKSAINLQSVEAVEWPDSGLGSARPEESCLMVITPGYRVLLEANDTVYQVNTNLDGSVFRLLDQPQKGSGNAAPGSDAAAQAARAYLAQQLGKAEDSVVVASVEAVDWPNSCLGIDMPARVCSQVVTPGFRVTLEADGKQFEFHTDQGGGAVVEALAPLPDDAQQVVTWEDQNGAACLQGVIGAQTVQYGACGEKLETADLPDARKAELAVLYGTYAGFEAQTPAGKVTFSGGGQHLADEAEMRSAAEWAKLVVAEVMTSRGDENTGLVITYHREGGFAGFCSDASIYRSGWVAASSCKGGTSAAFEPYRLNGEELARLYAWVDELGGFRYEQKDNATADAMTTQVVFDGAGSAEAAPEQKDEIARFAERAYSAASAR